MANPIQLVNALSTESNSSWYGFGRSVATYGDRIYVGADYATDTLNGEGAGAIYVYKYNSSSAKFELETSLVPDWGNFGGTGFSIAVDGKSLLVGSPLNVNFENVFSGGVDLYVSANNEYWYYFTDDTGADYDQFGTSVALAPSTYVVGAVGKDLMAGQVYAYKINEEGSLDSYTIKASDQASGAGFGYSVAAFGETIVVGSPMKNANAGGAYIYTYGASGNYVEEAIIEPGSDGVEFLGEAVAISNDTVVLGASEKDGGKGAVYIYRKDAVSGKYTLLQTLTSTNASDIHFGTSVSINGDNLMVGTGDSGSATGNAYYYAYDAASGQFVVKQTLTFSGTAGHGFAYNVSISGQNIVIGSYCDNYNYPSEVGVAYAYKLELDKYTWNFGKFFSGSTADSFARINGSNIMETFNAAGGRKTFGSVANSEIIDVADVNNDQIDDIIAREAGMVVSKIVTNGISSEAKTIGQELDSWKAIAIGDINNDNQSDVILVEEDTGNVAAWLVDKGLYSDVRGVGKLVDNWEIAGMGDFNGDGSSDVLLKNTATGGVATWILEDGSYDSTAWVGTLTSDWDIVEVGDFNGDGTDDVMLQDASGNVAAWLIEDGAYKSVSGLGKVSGDWSIAGVGNFDGDAKNTCDVALYNSVTNELAAWRISEGTYQSAMQLA